MNKYHIPEGKIILLMNSRIAEVKNHLVMVEAIHNLSDEAKEKIVVVCTGDKSGNYYNRVCERINDYGLNHEFIFTGWADPYELLAISDFMFCPSFAEGFPLNCVEAFFMKVPVARTMTGGYENMKDACVPISAEGYRPINDIVMNLVSDKKSRYHELTEYAYQYAYSNCTVERMTENTLDVYHKAIKTFSVR